MYLLHRRSDVSLKAFGMHLGVLPTPQRTPYCTTKYVNLKSPNTRLYRLPKVMVAKNIQIASLRGEASLIYFLCFLYFCFYITSVFFAVILGRRYGGGFEQLSRWLDLNPQISARNAFPR